MLDFSAVLPASCPYITLRKPWQIENNKEFSYSVYFAENHTLLFQSRSCRWALPKKQTEINILISNVSSMHIHQNLIKTLLRSITDKQTSNKQDRDYSLIWQQWRFYDTISSQNQICAHFTQELYTLKCCSFKENNCNPTTLNMISSLTNPCSKDFCCPSMNWLCTSNHCKANSGSTFIFQHYYLKAGSAGISSSDKIRE